jgi:hypothetical protein
MYKRPDDLWLFLVIETDSECSPQLSAVLVSEYDKNKLLALGYPAGIAAGYLHGHSKIGSTLFVGLRTLMKQS